MTERFSIIPNPVSIKYSDGFFKSRGLPVIKGDDKFNSEIKIFTQQLLAIDREYETRANKSEKQVVCQKSSKDMKEEEYCLIITPDLITIEAASCAGMYHGLQTFRQLVISEYNNGELILPCAEIRDYPRFSWRGFMLDSSRYFYSVQFIIKIIDVISLHHINRFHWHLTDDQGWRLPVPQYPLLAEIGSRRQEHRFQWVTFSSQFYSEEEIQQVVEYAKLRHIEVIPEVDLPGHTSSILAAYPGLGCLGGPYRVEDRHGIFEDVLCAGNDQIFDLFSAVFDTLARLFPSKWVHIGGDEVMFNRWQQCPKCQKRLKELGLEKPSELQSWITQKLVQLLTERGKTAIAWDEVLDDSQKFPLPKELIVMSWRGTKGGIQAGKLGHRAIMSPNTEGCYFDYKHQDTPEEPGQMFGGAAPVSLSYSTNPVPAEMSAEESKYILGGQCNMWSELIYAGKIAEYMIFPRLCAVSEAVWSPFESKDFEDFSKRLGVHGKRLDFLEIGQYRGSLK